jgi:hypothetical protein
LERVLQKKLKLLALSVWLLIAQVLRITVASRLWPKRRVLLVSSSKQLTAYKELSKWQKFKQNQPIQLAMMACAKK